LKVNRSESASWIDEGEKYAIIGLSVGTQRDIPLGIIAPNLWVLANNRFSFPSHWKEWLGTIRSKQVEGSNLFLLSKLRSEQLDVLDSENQRLQGSVLRFYVGLILASTFSTEHKPVMLTGSRRDGQVDVRQLNDFDILVPCEFRRFPTLTATNIETGARLAGKIERIEKTFQGGGAWRLLRVLHLYQETRTTVDILERLHQYSRCIDGLTLPKVGKTKSQFKSRTGLFIGRSYHDLMGEIYDVRSAVEHLYENRYLGNFDREVRLDLLRKETIVEHIAHTSITRIVENPALWPHFANTASLGAFWALPGADRKAIWGEPVDPMVALAGFDPKFITDATPGKT
jgi:hypothetical protein